MISLHESLNKVHDDKQFKDWKNENPEGYLCHCFKMIDEEDAWNIGYCVDNKVTTFFVSSSAVEMKPEEKAFKHPDSSIKKLDEESIKITANKAMDIAKEFAKNNYPRDPPKKSILILQNLDIGQVYNITFITLAMSTLNIKVSSEDGKVLEHKKTSLMDFKMDK